MTHRSIAEWLWDEEAKELRGQGTEMLRDTEVEGQKGRWKDRQRAQRLRDREAEGQRNQGTEGQSSIESKGQRG